MKKVISLVLALAMGVLLCACGKSEAVVNTEGLISAIGEVSLESKDAIDKAQKAFDALSADEKAEVENYFVLVESMDTYKQLEEAEKQRLLEEAEKAKFSISKEAYNSIKTAWTVAERIGDDLYNVWHGCVWEKDDLSSKGLQFFVDKTSLSMEEVLEGCAARNYINEQYAKTKITWNEIDEEMKQFYRDATVKAFEKASRTGQYAAMDDSLWSIVNAYKLNGMIYETQELLETAKQAMKELPEDYEYYQELKGFYTTASALIDFCASPSGSLNQYSTLLNDYRKEARDYMNELDFVFE